MSPAFSFDFESFLTYGAYLIYGVLMFIVGIIVTIAAYIAKKKNKKDAKIWLIIGIIVAVHSLVVLAFAAFAIFT